MTIMLEIPEETEEKLRGKARARGMELSAFLRLIAQREADQVETVDDLFAGYPSYDEDNEDDVAAIRAGVERGLADFAAGRYHSAADVHAKMKARHGIPD